MLPTGPLKTEGFRPAGIRNQFMYLVSAPLLQ